MESYSTFEVENAASIAIQLSLNLHDYCYSTVIVLLSLSIGKQHVLLGWPEVVKFIMTRGHRPGGGRQVGGRKQEMTRGH